MRVSFDRRMAVLSPAKAYSHQAYTSSGKHSFCPLSFIDILTISQSALRASGSDNWDPFVTQSPSPSSPTASTSTAIIPTTPPHVRHDPPAIVDATTRALEDMGVYETEDHALRGFVCPSPVVHNSPRPRTQIDLCLPPVQAFHKPGDAILHAIFWMFLIEYYRRTQHVLATNTQPRLSSMASCLFGNSSTGSPLGLLKAIEDIGPDDHLQSLGMLQCWRTFL